MLDDKDISEPPEEPIWVPREYVVEINEDQIKKYGGTQGIQNEGLLDSALERPRNYWFYCSSSIFQLAAVYAQGLPKNHPFCDGNKRTAFVVAVIFLRFNGYRLEVENDEEIVEMMVKSVTDQISETDLTTWLKKYSVKIEGSS